MSKNKGRSREELLKLCQLSRQRSLAAYYTNPSFCKTCCKVIEVREGRPAHEARNKKFCSRSCSAKLNNTTRLLSLDFNKHLSTKVDCLCEECKKPFKQKPYHIKKVKHIFCSKVCSALFRKKIRGKDHPSWKGTTPAANAFYMSPEWKELRTKVFIRDDYTCRGCNKRGGQLEANHIKPRSKFPELKLEISNIETLCKPCHRELTRVQRATKQI